MPEPRKPTKILRKNRDNVKTVTAEDFVSVPRETFEKMKNIIKGLGSVSARARDVLPEIETIK